MNRFIDIIPSRCVACGTCRAACSEGHRRAGLQKEPRLTLVENRGVAAVITCHHCEGAPCYKVCPVNAIRMDADGCVRVDEVHCIGCKLCAVACPYGAIHMSGTTRAGFVGIEYNTSTLPRSLDPILRWEIGISPVAVKCDLCEFNDYKPKCVEACITEALRLVEMDDNDHNQDVADKRQRSVESELVMFENMDKAAEGSREGAAKSAIDALQADFDTAQATLDALANAAATGPAATSPTDQASSSAGDSASSGRGR